MRNYYLAVDIGASSGRHMLAWVENGLICMEEIHRFSNGMAKKDGHLCWDYEKLFGDIVEGLKKCKELGKIPVSNMQLVPKRGTKNTSTGTKNTKPW